MIENKNRHKKTLHVVCLPLHFIFQQINGRKIIHHSKKANGDFLYLVSAHVEASESGGISSVGRHLSAHFSNVADYQKGKEIGMKKLNIEPSSIKLLEDQGFVKKDNDKKIDSNRNGQPSLNRVQLIGTASMIGFFLFSFALLSGLVHWLPTASKPSDIISSAIYSISMILIGAIPIIGAFLTFYSDRRILVEKEKDTLWVLSMTIAFVFIGIGLISLGLYFNPLAFFLPLGFYFMFFSIVYLMGLINAKTRFLVVVFFILTLQVILIQVVPGLIGTQILSHYQLQVFASLISAIIITFLAGFFFNFMKGVEIILEMEHSFALVVGTKNFRRKEIRNKLKDALGIDNGKESSWQQFANLVRVYLGFRPQGVIDFHIDLDKEFEPRIAVLEDTVGFYPVEVNYDGNSLIIKSKTKSTNSSIELCDFVTH